MPHQHCQHAPPSATVFATEPHQVAAVNEAIHDYWFDVDRITFDASASTLSLPFPRPPAGAVDKHVFVSRKHDEGNVESVLRIKRVRRWRIEDTNKVGYYDFNELRYDPGKKVIRITTGIPILIEIEVERLEVAVEIRTPRLSD